MCASGMQLALQHAPRLSAVWCPFCASAVIGLSAHRTFLCTERARPPRYEPGEDARLFRQACPSLRPSITSAHHHSPQTTARALLLCACPPRASTQPSAVVILAARLSTIPSPQPAPSCIHELASSSVPRYRRPRSPIELHGRSTCSPRADPRSVLPIETHFADHIGLFSLAPCHRAAAPTGFSDSRHEPGESRGLAPVAGPAGRRCFAK